MDGPDLRRRKLLGGVVAGAAIVPLARSTNGFAVNAMSACCVLPGRSMRSTFSNAAFAAASA